MTALGVVVHGHVLLAAAEGTAAGDCLDEGAEFGGIEGIAEDEEVGEEVELRLGEVGEGGKIPRLVYLESMSTLH